MLLLLRLLVTRLRLLLLLGNKGRIELTRYILWPCRAVALV